MSFTHSLQILFGQKMTETVQLWPKMSTNVVKPDKYLLYLSFVTQESLPNVP